MSTSGVPAHADRVTHLATADAERLWIDVLRRQGLGGGRKLRSAYDVARLSLGLHAARLPSPYTTALARVDDPASAEDLFSSGPARRLITVRCMRKTLHTLPEHLAGAAHTATRHFRERDARRLAVNAGLAPAELEALVDDIRELLTDGGELGHRDIEAFVSARSRTSPAAVRIALKFAWEVGHLVYRNVSPHWNRERRRFTLARAVTHHITTDGDRTAATDVLVTSYFDRYGPASVKDAMWWSGLSATAIRAGLARSGRPIATVPSPWGPDDLYVFADRCGERASDDARPDDVDFLAHEDVALKAYFQTRRRYLDDLPAAAVFNRIGEVLPAILVRGRVIGRWSWDAGGRCVEWELFASTRPLRRVCESRAEEMTCALRSRHDGDRQPLTPTSVSR